MMKILKFTQRGEYFFNSIISKLFYSRILSSSCIWFLHLVYSCSQFPFRHLCCTATERLKYHLFLLFDTTKHTLCNLGFGTVAALLPKHYVMMKRAGVLFVQQTLFSGRSLSRANYIFEMPTFSLFHSIQHFPFFCQIVNVHYEGEAKSRTSCGSSLVVIFLRIFFIQIWLFLTASPCPNKICFCSTGTSLINSESYYWFSALWLK